MTTFEMTASEMTARSTDGATRFVQPDRAAAVLFHWLASTYRAGRAAEHLRGLSDSQLRDIGIARHEIDMVVRGSRR